MTSVTIPDSVTSIGEWAFYKCEKLQTISISDSVTSIGALAFFDCDSLSSVVLPGSITYIGSGAFLGCTSLKSITVERDSYAEQYCISEGLVYTFPDSLDWLSN